MSEKGNGDHESDTSGSVKEYMGPVAGSWDVNDKTDIEPVIQQIDKESESSYLIKAPKKYFSFKAALEFLPKEFDGQNIPVRKFIKNCRFAEESIDPSERHNLFLLIRSRITGNAETSLENQEINNLNDLLDYLKSTFGKFKQLGQLNSMLATIAQKFNESVQDYGGRVGGILSQIIEVIKEKNESQAADGIIKSVRDAAAENFVIGLKRELSLRVRLEKPKSLLEAIKIAGEAEWEIAFEKTLLRGINEEQKPFHSKFNPKFKHYSENPRVRIVEKRGKRHEVNKSVNLKQEKMEDDIRVEPVIKRERVDNENEKVCFNCQKPGHIKNNCPEKSLIKSCHSCGQKGHVQKYCPLLKGEIKQEKSNNDTCQNCGLKNHVTENCKGVCRYCKKSGHLLENCFKLKNKKMKEQNAEPSFSKN